MENINHLLARLRNCGMPGSLEMQAADCIEKLLLPHPTALTIDLDKLEALAPCPFCGGSCQLTHGFTTQENWPDGAFSRVFCTVCQARQLFHKDDAAATAAWNRRIPLAAPAATAEPKVPEGLIDRIVAELEKEYPVSETEYPEHWAAYREPWSLRAFVVSSCIQRVKALAAAPTTQPVSAPSAHQDAKDAARYRWLCENNFDRQSVQIHTWQHWYEPHSVTGEPTEWKARVRGGALDRIIDAAMATSPTSTGAAKADSEEGGSQ